MPSGLRRLLDAVIAAGARPYIVGGAVRDARLGLPVKDFDVKVFGITSDRLKETLASVGEVNAVGEAFTVYKVAGLEGVEGQVDVSIPRRDSKVGPGHRGIAVAGDPGLSLDEASRRRDFTINAMLLDPFTGRVEDPHDGQADLAARRLRAVDAQTFGEDPLRALRAIQLAARFELTVEPETARLCSSMPLAELPPERIFGEIEKLVLKARRPSIGLRLMREWGMLPTLAPELLPLADTPQEPEWHPDGDVWIHTLLAMDEAAQQIADLDRPRALAVMLGTLCHDLGKPATTRFEDGRVRSKGHEEGVLEPTRTLLDRWNVHTLLGYDLRGQILALVGNHLKPYQLYKERELVTDGAIRRLSAKCEPVLLHRVARADCLGRSPGQFSTEPMDWFLRRAQELDVARRPPEPILKGRDLLALGLSPGPEIGRVLKAVYERQLDGAVTNLAEACAEARRVLGWLA